MIITMATASSSVVTTSFTSRPLPLWCRSHDVLDAGREGLRKLDERRLANLSTCRALAFEALLHADAVASWPL